MTSSPTPNTSEPSTNTSPAKNPTEYCLGFLFSSDLQQVALIRKEKPEWQRGLLNGIGGKLETDETPFTAMVREFKEETGADYLGWNQNPCLVMGCHDWMVYVFASRSTAPLELLSTTTEQVGWSPINPLPGAVVPNIRWLVPYCLDHLHSAGPDEALVRYRV